MFFFLAGLLLVLVTLARFRPLLLKTYTWPIWLALALLMFLLMGFNLPFLFSLTLHGQTAEAVIETVRPDEHCVAKYRYQVQGREFTGQEAGKCSLAVGSRQPVYYDPLHPDRAILTAPKAALANDLIPALLAALLFPVLILYALRRFQRSLPA